ncbi:MAG: hypothetical protein SGILL_000188 [Bacillariaceae sp.]
MPSYKLSHQQQHQNHQHRSVQSLQVDADSEPVEQPLFFDLYESPCVVKASNDAFEYSDYETFSLMCNETFFGGCHYESVAEIKQDQDSQESNIVEWKIVFDYEIYYTRDPIPAVEHMESIVLEHMSEITGLNGCGGGDDGEEEKEDISDIAFTRVENNDTETGTSATTTMGRVGAYDGGYRRKAQSKTNKEYFHDFTDDEMERMMAISSDPSDVLDPDHMPSSVSSNADCMPVTGAIHLYLNNTDGALDEEKARLSIESGFQRLIRFGMQQGLYVSGNIKHASFIGTRIFPSDSGVNSAERGAATNEVDSPGVIQGDNRAGIIIGVVGGLVLMALLITLFVVRRKMNAMTTSSNEILVGANETTISSLQVDEENPYLVAKTPLSVTQRVAESSRSPVVQPSRTAGTMGLDLSDEDEEVESGDADEHIQLDAIGEDELGAASGDELKLFQDTDEEEEIESSTKETTTVTQSKAPSEESQTNED